MIVPRAYGSHHGLPRPVNAGTTQIPPLSSTVRASASTSADESMIRSSSRSHWTAAPVTKIDPSSTYVAGPSPIVQPTEVSSPSLGVGHDDPMLSSTKLPVP